MIGTREDDLQEQRYEEPALADHPRSTHAAIIETCQATIDPRGWAVLTTLGLWPFNSVCGPGKGCELSVQMIPYSLS